MITMSEQTGQTAKRELNRLSDEQLDQVTGGEVQDIHFTKQTDKASPNLFLACANGKHF